ncbi:MAG: hypothetical protein IIY02_04395, partial [Firmicutes bacterium]|nr:hypothetical protein [Bacillota bacterium]
MIFAVILFLIALAAVGMALISLNQLKKENARRERRGKPAKKPGISFFAMLGGAGVALLIGILVMVISLMPDFSPKMTDDSDPALWGIQWEIFADGTAVSEYEREDEILFGAPEEYFVFPGVVAFRGNNYRNSATYGTANISEQTIERIWMAESGELVGTKWAGSGWTGQPLVVKWDDKTKENMNLYTDKKAKSGLVEVIYATLDGNIYFLDLEDGTPTRDPIEVGMCFKGAGSLDPRGYPLMYVGSGDVNAKKERPRMFIISLIDGTILYEYGHEEQNAFRADN